jgi:tetratricopeptide (TPR) repeat protein
MKFVGKGFVLIGCFIFSFLLSDAEGLLLQDAGIERNTVLLNPNQRTASIGKAATVILIVNAADGTIGNGSGFFVGPDLIVTSIHVLAGIHGKSYTWEMRSVNQPAQYTIKSVVASDPEYDLVILRVEGQAAEVLQLGDSDTVQLGETVIAVGTHKSTDTDAFGKIIDGTINRITDNFFRVRATLLPGYSGGPVLNSTGEVIGISVEGGETKSSGYIIPSNRLKALLENMSEQEKSLEAWRTEPMIRAYALANRGDAEKVLGSAKSAIAAYNAAIRLIPDFAAVYAKRGSAKYNLGDYNGTIKDYDAAIGTGLDYASVYVNRGVAKRNLRHHKGAIKDYNTAIRLDPENIEAYLNRGNVRADLGNYEMAIEDYDAAIRLKPKSVILPLAYVKRASAKSDLGDNKGALKDYDKAVHLKPNTRGILIVAYLNRGIAKFDLGDAQSAIGDYDEVIRLKPRSAVLASAYVHRADAKAKGEDKNGAIKDYDAAARLVPENVNFIAQVYGKRAAVKLQLKDSKGAIEDCDAAILLDPDLAEVYKTRGEARSNLGNHSEAAKDYDTAVYIKPDYAEAYYKRGCAKVEIGNISAAKADFRTALKLAKWESNQVLMADIEEKLHLLK